MESTLKCSECGGSKCTQVSKDKYRCLYCGMTFSAGGTIPKETAVVPKSDVTPEIVETEETRQPQRIKIHDRSRIVAILLAFFLGDVGGQFFYLGSPVKGVLCILFCWTWIPAIISAIHGILLIIMGEEDFDEAYNYYQPE